MLRFSGLSGPAFQDAAAGWLPAVTAFLAVPWALLQSNANALDGALPLHLFWSPSLLAAWFILLILLRRALPGPGARVCIFLFYSGLFLILAERLLPLPMDPLLTGMETPEERPWHTVLEILLAAALMTAGLRIPWARIRRPASLFALAFFLLQGAALGVHLLGSSPSTPGKAAPTPISTPPEVRGNIYHIVLDAFPTPAFEQARQRLDPPPSLDGFILFKDNIANYLFTDPSRASFMTGSLLPEGRFQDWLQGPRTAGLIADVAAAGYAPWIYGHHGAFSHACAVRCINNSNPMSREQRRIAFLHLSDLTLLRLAPAYLRGTVFRDGLGLFSRIYGNPESKAAGCYAIPVLAANLMKTMTAQEIERPARGQYVHAHLFLPHPPYVLDEQCRYAPDAAENGGQEACALRLLDGFLQELKNQGKYENALILIQADHGNHHWHSRTGQTLSPTVTPALRGNLRGFTPKSFSNRARCLLMVKPPGRAGAPLETSTRPTQLLDVPATLYALAGLDLPGGDGMNVLAPDFPEDRPRDVFIGWPRNGPNGETMAWGREMKQGPMNRLRLQNGQWRRLEDVLIRW